MKGKKFLAPALAVILLLGGLTWAAQAVVTRTVTGAAENTIRYGSLALRVVETKADGTELTADDIATFDLTAHADAKPVEGGKAVERRVLVANECDHAMYVRVRPVLELVKEDGSAVPLAADGTQGVTIVWAGDLAEQWAGPDEDGWYVYQGVLAGMGEKTPALITALTFDTDALKGTEGFASVALTVDAQALQAENDPLPEGGYAGLTGWPE